jgi:colicin import membrane protein
MTASIQFVLALALLLTGAITRPAVAPMVGDPPVRDQQRIADERAAAVARFGERQRECLQRFVATPCVDEAKRERRETLSRLRREQNQLDDSLRKARAAERNEAIRERQGAQAVHEEVPVRGRVAREPSRPASAAPRAQAPAAGRAIREPQRSEQEARSRASFDAAQHAAEAHRAEVEARNARREAKHKPAAPLPLPPGASAP